MEIQIPLIIFTSFLAWSAGMFAIQGYLGFKGEGKSIQLVTLITALIIMIIGGICVFFHLARPMHILNGFGMLSSGITQEIIAVVIVGVAMVVYFLLMWRSEDKASVPKWMGIVALVVAVALDIVMAHSYMMGARPAWDTVLQAGSILGASCVLGPATVMFIAAVRKDEDTVAALSPLTLLGSIVNAVLAIAYIIYIAAVQGMYTSVGYYFDPTSPTMELFDTSTASPFSGDAIVWTVLAIVFAVVAALIAYIGPKRKLSATGVTCGVIIAGLVCTVVLRVLFYVTGASIFPLYVSTLA